MTTTHLKRSYYSNSFHGFLKETNEEILGSLAANTQFELEISQRNAWVSQISFLKQTLADFNEGHILFEFTIPRIGKRADNILIIEGTIFVVEFKVGQNTYSSDAINQVFDYALDLKNFHAGSYNPPIVPILVATIGDQVENKIKSHGDRVFEPLKLNQANFGRFIHEILGKSQELPINPIVWESSAYQPTPTIVEAARALYEGHDVTEISRSDAANLEDSAKATAEIIDYAKASSKKAICFITGVPGSGKTLAGLNLANSSSLKHGVFLSGNGPLVAVLQEALTRSEIGKGNKRNEAERKTRSFIQLIHHFRDDALIDQKPPAEKVAVFDEAQRAWTNKKLSQFMSSRKGIPEFKESEPEFLLSVMDRNKDWTVLICLVGGGQEINTGEAGLLEWFNSLKSYPHWEVYVSPNLIDSEYTQGKDLYSTINPERLHQDNRLHLATSIRSFRSERVSQFVKATLDLEVAYASEAFKSFSARYPVLLTRNLELAKGWVREKARGSERYGVISSSGAERLKPFGINVGAPIDPRHWFLNDKEDVRSSFYLEDVATEFDVQGLELDWAIVGWDANLRFSNNCWQYFDFKGTKWQSVRDESRQNYLKNSYRVLLTRARQGMVIFVPFGDTTDRTRKPFFYDGTYDYLKSLGLSEL